MTREELLAEMELERYAPRPAIPREHPTDQARRRRVLLGPVGGEKSCPEDFRVPRAAPAVIDGEVLRMRGLRWTARQIASLLRVEVRAVDAVLTRHGLAVAEVEEGEA